MYAGATGISCTLHSATFACAAFCKESRMKFASATKLDRKSGGTLIGYGFSDPRKSLEGGTERLWDQEKPYEDYRM